MAALPIAAGLKGLPKKGRAVAACVRGAELRRRESRRRRRRRRARRQWLALLYRRLNRGARERGLRQIDAVQGRFSNGAFSERP